MGIREDNVKEVKDLLQEAYNKYNSLSEEEKEEVTKFLGRLEELEKEN